MKGEVSKVFSMDYNRLMTLDADSIYSSVLSNSYISSYSSLSHFIVKHTKLSLHALANFIFRFYLSLTVFLIIRFAIIIPIRGFVISDHLVVGGMKSCDF